METLPFQNIDTIDVFFSRAIEVVVVKRINTENNYCFEHYNESFVTLFSYLKNYYVY